MRQAIKSQMLAKKLRDAIHSGELLPEMILPHEVELAATNQLSRGTVRTALDELEKQKLIRRIRGKGTIICSPKPECTSIKVILPGPGTLSWSLRRIMHGIISEADQHGIRVETIMSTCDHKPEHMNFKIFQSLSRKDCVILPGLEWWRPILPILADIRCNLAYLDNCNSDNLGKILPYVQNWKRFVVDFPEITRLAHRYLRKLGRKRTLIFQQSRLEAIAYFDELRQDKTEFDPRLFIPYEYGYGICDDPKQQRRNLRNYLIPYLERAFFEAHADSIILNNGDIATTLMELLEELDLRVPEDVSIVAVEDYSRMTGQNFPVSAFQFSRIELGRCFVRCFLNEYFTPEVLVQQPFFVERESSRKGAGNPEGLAEDISPHKTENYY